MMVEIIIYNAIREHHIADNQVAVNSMDDRGMIWWRLNKL